MLEITIPETELYDESKNLFIPIKSQRLSLEHSLLSLSKWESEFCKPLLPLLTSDEGIGSEEMINYIRCMTINKNVDPLTYYGLTNQNIEQITEYINAPMTATTITNLGPETGRRPEIMTAEIFYYRMIMYGIPFECQKWHLNRLMMLLRVFAIKNSPQKKMSKAETARMFDELNRQRLAKSGKKG